MTRKKMICRPIVGSVLLQSCLFGFAVPTAYAVSLDWVRQLGTDTADYGLGVSADGLGNVYISGYTSGGLDGPSAGGNDAFVSKYNAAGDLQWTRQLGTGAEDFSNEVSADGLGNVYISGYTSGNLGGPNAGNRDVFVSKYNATGVLQWTRQLGTAADDISRAVSADGLGNVYISGFTYGSLGGPIGGTTDAFVSKYDANGNFQWTKQVGTAAQDFSDSVYADGSGNIYISGKTAGNLGGPSAGDYDAFVSKYNAAGDHQWTRQLGTAEEDYSLAVSADGLGNVYISGNTYGSLGGPNAGIVGTVDAFVSKYDAAGNPQWTRQFGTAGLDYGTAVSVDGFGNVYVSGETAGSLGGPIAGSADAYIRKYDAAGNHLWTQQLGTSNADNSEGVSADGLGNFYISGLTNSSLGGPNAGSYDAYVAKYSDPIIPEPSSLILVVLAAVALVGRGFHRRLICRAS